VHVTVAAATSSPPTSIYHGRNLPGTRKDAGQCAYYAGSRHHVGGFARFEMVLSRKCWPRVQSRAPSRPKTKAMAKLSGLTVALHVLHGTRWSSCSLRACFPDRVLPAGGPRRARVARSAHHAAAPERKACRSCHEVKPIADYAVDRSRRTGYAGICKACDCTRSSARYHRNTPGAVSRHERKRIRTARPGESAAR